MTTKRISLQGNDGRILFKVKPSDETISNDNVLSNDSHLVFTVKANRVYLVWCVLFVQGAVASDFQSAFTIPTNAVGRRNNGALSGANVGTSAIETTLIQVLADTGQKHIDLVGSFFSGDGGSFNLQWSQETAIIENTVLKRGSWIMLFDGGASP